MEWMPKWSYWQNNWKSFFPKATYGQVWLDTHIYDFKNTVAEEEEAWDNEQWPSVRIAAAEVFTLIGEYTLSLSADIPTD